MEKYRVVKYSNDTLEYFKVQKRSIFGFWYNFNNIDAYSTGIYDTKHDALSAIARHKDKLIKTIINV